MTEISETAHGHAPDPRREANVSEPVEKVRRRRSIDPALIAHREALGEEQRAAVRAFMFKNDLRPAEWCRAAGLPGPTVLYNFLNGRSQFLAGDTLSALATAIPGASVAEIIGELPQGVARVRLLPCRTQAKLNAWRQSYAWFRPGKPSVNFPMPEAVKADEVVHLADDHASDIYPAGSLLAVQDLGSMGRPLRNGERVLLHRMRRGQHEITVREVVVEGDRARLILRGADHSAIDLHWPYDGRQWSLDGDMLQIRARISMQASFDGSDDLLA